MSGLSSERREQALALLARLDPQAPDQVAANLDALSPDFAELVLGFAFADVLSRPGIDLCTREMLTVAALMAMGNAPGQLEFHIRAALNVGVSRETIIEILLQIAVYAGVPACMNGISAARTRRTTSKPESQLCREGLTIGAGITEPVVFSEKMQTRREPRLPSCVVLQRLVSPVYASSTRAGRTLGLNWESMTPLRIRPPPSR